MLIAPKIPEEAANAAGEQQRRSMAELVKVEQRDKVAIVTLDHPPVNALSQQLLEELEEIYDELDRGDEARVIVLRGEGEKAFVAGADITEFPALREQVEQAATEGGSARGIQKLAGRMDAGRTPVIAAIHGYCLGGGLELAMACDIRIAAEDARLGQPEIKLGLIPGGGGTQRLPRLVGHGRALYLNLSGDPIAGSQAYEWGLVEKAVPRAELLDAALELAGTLAQRSPHSMGVIKQLAAETRDLPLSEGMRREAQGFLACISSEDGAEGVMAFLEKREPQFTGR
jgi:enoyl-CoA hydratase/carnithine racemase